MKKLPPLWVAFALLSFLASACGSSDDAATDPQEAAPSSDGGAGGADVATAGSASAGAPSAGAPSADDPSAAAGSSATEAEVLSQTGNPVVGMISNYTDWLSTAADEDTRLAEDETRAANIISWQLPHGGFYKNDVDVYAAPWNGSDSRSGWTGAGGVELGTIDNDATVTELLFLADVYARAGDSECRESARAALEFLLGMQYPSGGFPQVYPARTGTTYSNHVTFNDNAMIRAMLVLQQAAELEPPLAGDLFTSEQRDRAREAVISGVDYILRAQIVQDGVKTVWCAQHDPDTYEPRGARSYELASKSGKESRGVVGFLLTQPQTEEVREAVQAALAWYASESVMVADTAYVKRPSSSTDDTYNPIQARAGSTMWYRFYDLDEDVGFFSGRLPTDDPPGVGKQYDIMEIEPERRYGYEWGGSYGTPLLDYARSVGY